MRTTYKTYETTTQAQTAALRLCALDLRARVERDGVTVSYDTDTLDDLSIYPRSNTALHVQSRLGEAGRLGI